MDNTNANPNSFRVRLKLLIFYLRLLNLHSDDLLPLTNDLHQLIALLHQLGFMHGCVHLERQKRPSVKSQVKKPQTFTSINHRVAVD